MALLSRKSEPEEKPDTDAADEGTSYDALADELGDILGLDSDKAQRLRDAICSLAREEMSREEEAPEEEKKPTGIAILMKRGSP
jgi:hypothetical protein